MIKEVDKIKDEIIDIRRELHKYPEVGFDLKKTCKLVETKLKEYGIEVSKDYGKRSLVGIIKGEGEKVIALRADMDALNMQEENDVSYKSLINEKMHACGHDGHTAMLLGAAKILAQNKEKIKGTVKLIFQASEEGPYSGAKYMVEDGVIDDVDVIFGMHLTTGLPVGKVEICCDRSMASANAFEIELIGKGGHAGSPHMTVDAISMAVRVVTEIQYLVSREINPLEPIVISVGTLHSGYSTNVISETAKLTGTIRSYSKDLTEKVTNKMENIVKHITEISEGSYKFNVLKGVPPLINDSERVIFSSKVCEKVLGKSNVLVTNKSYMGSEDFAFYAEKVPAVFIFLGAGNEEKNFVYYLHHPKFDFDEDALINGSKIFIQHVLDYLN